MIEETKESQVTITPEVECTSEEIQVEAVVATEMVDEISEEQQQTIIAAVPTVTVADAVASAVATTTSTSTAAIPSTAIITPAVVFSLNREVLRCQVADHDMARVKFLCVDSGCRCASKLACAECILNDHKDHKYFVLEKFVEQVSSKFTKVASAAASLEDESRMEDFQNKITNDVRTEFSEIKQLVMRSFDEFEREYLAQISKCFENSKPRMDHRDKFASIAKLASENFETLNNEAIQQVVHFHADEKLERTMEDIEKNITKSKAAISKKKAKYFEKFRAIVSDILANCKTVPLKDSMTLVATSPTKSALVTPNSAEKSYASANSAALLNSEEKKKRKITFNDEQNVVYETPSSAGSNASTAAVSLNAVANAIQQVTKQSNISELQSFSARSFAGETRRFTNAVHKKLKTESAQQAITSTS